MTDAEIQQAANSANLVAGARKRLIEVLQGLNVKNITVNTTIHEAVDTLEASAVVNSADGTATAAHILNGKTAYVNGKQITGTISTVTPSVSGETLTVPQGYIAEQKSYSTVSGTVGATAAAGDIRSGKTAYVNGEKITGTIENVTASLSNNTVTVPVGYIASEQKLSVPVVTASSDGSMVTVPVGYIAEEQSFTIMTGGGTNTSDATVIASKLLEGVTAYGASGKVTGNIKTVTATDDGTNITVPVGYIAAEQVFAKISGGGSGGSGGGSGDGGGSSGGSTAFYKCAYVDKAGGTWSGYAGTFSGGEWVFSDEITSGLRITAIVPVEDYIYNADASIRVTSINNDQRHNDVFRFIEFTSPLNDELIYGTEPTSWGLDADVSGDVSGLDIPCVASAADKNSGYHAPSDTYGFQYRLLDEDGNPAIFGGESFTVAFWSKMPDISCAPKLRCAFLNSNGTDGVAFEVDHDRGYVLASAYLEDGRVSGGNDRVNAYAYNSPLFDRNYWHHWAFVYDHRTGELRSYIDGILCGQNSSFKKDDMDGKTDFTLENAQVYIGSCSSSSTTNPSRLGDMVISKTAYTDEQVQWLARKSRSVARLMPLITVPGETVVITAVVGSELYKSIDVGANFDAEIQMEYSGVPDWILSLPSTVFTQTAMGLMFYVTPTEAGTATIACRASCTSPSSLAGTVYEGVEIADKTFNIQINAAIGTIELKINHFVVMSVEGNIPGYVSIDGNKLYSNGDVVATFSHTDGEVTATASGATMPITVNEIYDMEIRDFGGEGSELLQLERDTLSGEYSISFPGRHRDPGWTEWRDFSIILYYR